MLCKLVREAEEFGLVLARDLIGSALGFRAAGAKAWLDRCRLVITDLGNPANDQATLDAALRRAEAVAADADRLSCNVTKDLERLKVRLQFACSCRHGLVTYLPALRAGAAYPGVFASCVKVGPIQYAMEDRHH